MDSVFTEEDTMMFGHNLAHAHALYERELHRTDIVAHLLVLR